MKHAKPKLVLLYGFAGSGKTTLAKRYIEGHQLALLIEEDQLIVQIGSWLEHETEARTAVHDMIEVMVASYLRSGHDVVVPILPMDASWLTKLQAAVSEGGATLHELYLEEERTLAIARLFERGSWGEAGSPPITEADRPLIEQMYDAMTETIATRKNVTVIARRHDDIAQNYIEMLTTIE